jgi:hypothetical protein
MFVLLDLIFVACICDICALQSHGNQWSSSTGSTDGADQKMSGSVTVSTALGLSKAMDKALVRPDAN